MPAANMDQVRVAKTTTATGDFLSVALEPNSQHLWVGSSDFRIYSIDFAAGLPTATPALEGHSSYVSGLVLAGRKLVSAGWDRRLIWWDLETRRPIRTVDAHGRWIRQLSPAEDRSAFASASDDMTCKLWDTQTGRMIRQFSGFSERLHNFDYPNKIAACALSPDGKHLAATDGESRVLMWDTESGREIARFDATAFLYRGMIELGNNFYAGIRRMAFSPDGRRLAIAGIQNGNAFIHAGGGLLQIFDWNRGEKTYELKVAAGQFEALKWHPRSAWILAAHGTAYLLDPSQPRVLKESNAGGMAALDAALDDSATTLYTVGRGKAVQWILPA
jgi:WD40 repeat protein